MNAFIENPHLPVATIETFPFRPELVESIHTVLAEHGITIEHGADRCVLHFPVGTSKFELLPRVRESRYEVCLPDGSHLYETLSHEEGGLSLVRFNLADFPEAMHEQLLQDLNVSGGEA